MGTYKYSAGFRADAVAPARSSHRPVSRIAAEFGVNHETLRQWIKTAENTERPEALAESTKDAEIAALRKQVHDPTNGRDPPGNQGRALVNRFQFVADHRDAFGVKRLCTVLNLSRSGFCRWLKTAPARAAKKATAALTRRIRKIHSESGKTYGAKRITAELREGGAMVNRKRVERLMRQHGPGIPHAPFHRHYADLIDTRFRPRIPAVRAETHTDRPKRDETKEENLRRLRQENTDLRRTLALYEEAIRQLALENHALCSGATVVPLPARIRASSPSRP